MVALEDLLDRRVLSDLPKHGVKLFFAEEIGRADIVLHLAIDKIYQRLRNEYLANFRKDGHLVSDLSRSLLEHQ